MIGVGVDILKGGRGIQKLGSLALDPKNIGTFLGVAAGYNYAKNKGGSKISPIFWGGMIGRCLVSEGIKTISMEKTGTKKLELKVGTDVQVGTKCDKAAKIIKKIVKKLVAPIKLISEGFKKKYYFQKTQ